MATKVQEPELETISDYNSLQGEKKRVVWAVVITGLLIGSIYVIANKIYGDADDTIKVEKTIATVPVK
jgi:hypothetical protein